MSTRQSFLIERTTYVHVIEHDPINNIFTSDQFTRSYYYYYYFNSIKTQITEPIIHTTQVMRAKSQKEIPLRYYRVYQRVCPLQFHTVRFPS